MSDLNEINSPSKLPIRNTVSTAWQQVKGFKALAWGGTGFYILISIGISLAAGIIFAILLNAFGLPTGTQNLEQSGLAHEPVLTQGLQMLLNLFISFFTAPLVVGQIMLAVRHLRRSPETTVYRLFDYFKWRFMWRFFVVSLILIAFIFACIFAIALLVSTTSFLPQHIPAVAYLIKGLIFAAVIVFLFALIYLMISLQFSQLLIADHGLSVGASLKNSLSAVRKNFWRILGVFLLCVLILLPIELILVGVFLGFSALHLEWLGTLIVIASIVTLIIWLLPWGLLVNGLIYERLFGNNSQI